LAADESVLQCITERSRKHLDDFLQQPSRETVTFLFGIPIVYNVVKEASGNYSPSLLGALAWMNERAKTVFNQLKKYALPEVTLQESEDWRVVSNKFTEPNEKANLKLDGLLL
jgi:hypothetical protein